MLQQLRAAKAVLCVPGCCEVLMAAVTCGHWNGAKASEPRTAPRDTSAADVSTQHLPGHDEAPLPQGGGAQEAPVGHIEMHEGSGNINTERNDYHVACDGAPLQLQLLHIVPVSQLPSQHPTQGVEEDCVGATHAPHATHEEEAAGEAACQDSSHSGRDSRRESRVHGIESCMHWMHECAAEILGEFAFGANGVARSASPAGVLCDVDSAAQQGDLEKLGWTVLRG